MAQTADQARKRNWQKARITSMVIDPTVLTEKEKEVAIKILRLRNELLKDWDVNSAYLSGKPLKTYKCWCGQRTNVERLSKHDAQGGGPQYLCKKHFKDEQEV